MHQISSSSRQDDLSDEDYGTLATFRWELRRFLRFSEQAARQSGLNAQQYQALLAIRAAPSGELLVGALAEQLLIRPHSATELIDRLAKAELVSREPSPADRRQVSVKLTSKAGALMTTLAADHRHELQRLRPLLSGLLDRL